MLELATFLKDRLSHNLPGREAQIKMAPEPVAGGQAREMEAPDHANISGVLVLLFPNEKNNPELVDAVMRLTPAATFLGILGMAGANMTWATPIVLAMCGGEKIVEMIRKLKP